MAIETAIPIIVTAIGTLFAAWKGWNAEQQAKAAKQQSEAAEEIARADKAKSEYVDMLERQINRLKEQMTERDIEIGKLQTRLGKLEAAEEICQTERQRLLALLGIQGKGIV